MAYIRKISSLEEKASAQVAISLCQENDFKEVALCLEKPTYGAFIHWGPYPPFVSDPEILSEWAKMKQNDWQSGVFLRSCHPSGKMRVEQWDAAVDEQCQKLTKGLPYFLKHGVCAWINRIALEYLCYCRRQEVLFGVSRYFLMDILTREDWTEAGRIDEEKIARQLVNDERLTVLQRYRIACIYYIQVNIPPLGKRLSRDEQQWLCSNDKPSLSEETNNLVLLWSYYMLGRRDEKVTRQKDQIWACMVQQAVCYGNLPILKLYWRGLEENIQKEIVIDMALESLQKWQSIQDALCTRNNWRERLVSNELPCMRLESIERFNLPSYYNELVCFFLSEMNDEQQLSFFQKAFESKYCDSILECFLDWPHQDDFLPTINRLWGIMPKDKYGQCLLALASKYSGDYDKKHSCTSLYKKENCYYDYRSLLRTLWEETPEEYRQYVFCDKKPDSVVYSKKVINEGKVLLPRLLVRSPFLEKDKALFNRFLRDLQKEEKMVIMRSTAGEEICSILTQKENWSFVTWLLEECLPKEDIPSFKKQFIQSDCGRRLCFYKLEENQEKLLEDLIDWSLDSDTEKAEFKCKIIAGTDCLGACESLLSKGKFEEVERMMNFCLTSHEMKKEFKERFTKFTCNVLLQDYAWEQMDKILAWCFETEEEVRDFKKGLFAAEGVNTHYRLVFIQMQLEDTEYFYEWFCLSPEEIRKVKKETLFKPEVIKEINEELQDDSSLSAVSLQWCVTDEESVINMKKILEDELKIQILNRERSLERLDSITNELLSGLKKKDVHGETTREDDNMKDKGDKRSFDEMEDDSSLPNKRFK